ncbi:hypothetical protein HYN59_14375 [Flavobacterium album]|uniref:Carboxypeptidase regulatory-like domain-containing protein n=1 Tax=Flavobacterium album TaxID=2175091 RepID=A0A2S1R0N2_9FLAO|nr:carboxypeptidase-like regulatory domain-containing protein [Flavobacterium album]AWH86222.1 hypothetical protein HYN59_14375 [Flavobacterium album]
MKKLLLALFVAGMSAGCGIDYLGSTKIIFEGRVTNPAGEPLEGIKVSTNISNSETNDEISYDFTDSNGNYRMIFPKAAEKVDIQLFINSDEANTELSQTVISNISFDDVEDYTIDFGTESLYQSQGSVAFHIDIQNNLPRKLQVLGMIAYKRIDYHFEGLPNDPGYGYPTDFFVAPNQVLTLRIMDPEGNIQEVQVPIGEENVTYTL